MTKKEVNAESNEKTQEKKALSSKAKKSESGQKFDFKKINFDNKILSVTFAIIFIMIGMYVAWDVRDGPISLDGLDKNIESNIYNNIRMAISQQIAAESPNLNEQYRQEKVEKAYANVVATGEYSYGGQTIKISDIVAGQSQNIKDKLKADNGQTYLTAIDPHMFLGQSRNYIKNGHMGTSLDEDGTPRLDYKLAPIGVNVPKDPDFHVWLESKLFLKNGLTGNSSIGEFTAAIFSLSAIIATLCAIPAFLILRQVTNNFSALIGTLVLVTIGTFVSRTVSGFVDTDAYQVLFPLLIVASLMYSFFSKNTVVKICYAVLSGFFVGMFLWAWGNGWFLFLFLSGALVAYIGYLVIENIISKLSFKEIFENIKSSLLVSGVFLISSFVFVKYFVDNNIFLMTYNGLFGGLGGITSFSGSNIWPNVLSSVAELNAAGFSQIVGSVGGGIIFLIALVGLTFLISDFKTENKKMVLIRRMLIIFSVIWTALIINANMFVFLTANSPLLFLVLLFVPVGLGGILSLMNNNRSEKIFVAILLSIWIAGTIYMSLNGVRFILLLAPAFAISFGVGMFYIFTSINLFLVKEMNLKTYVSRNIGGYLITGVLFLVLFNPMYTQANAIGDGVTPNFDDAWYGSMYKIKNESESDAIITSWWDFGHFFALVADRGVTFDGGSQTTPRAHWVGRILMENDEEVAHDMIQMLVCGGNEAHNTMLSYTTGTPADAIKVNKVLYTTFGKNSTETRELLAVNKYFTFDDSQLDNIMDYLSCEDPAEDFFITSQDMIGKAGVWAHWGSWDFNKKYVHDNYKGLSVEQMAVDIDESEILIQTYVDELLDIDLRAKTQDIKREDLVNQWFAPYPSYIPIQGQYEVPCEMDENMTLSCAHGLVISLADGDVKVVSGFEGQVKFKNVVIPTSLGTLMSVEQDADGDVDAFLLPSGDNSFNVVLAQSPLGASLFTKLYYYNGFGTKYFEAFDQQQSVLGNTIKVWKVSWTPIEKETDLSNQISEEELAKIQEQISSQMNAEVVSSEILDVEVEGGAKSPINETVSE